MSGHRTPAVVALGLILRRQCEAGFAEFEGSSATVFPEYADLRCTPDGAIWLQLFDIAGPFRRGANWYRIAADGSRTVVTLPEAFRPPDRTRRHGGERSDWERIRPDQPTFVEAELTDGRLYRTATAIQISLDEEAVCLQSQRDPGARRASCSPPLCF